MLFGKKYIERERDRYVGGYTKLEREIRKKKVIGTVRVRERERDSKILYQTSLL